MLQWLPDVLIFIQLQHQLEVTSNLCQRMLLEQAQQQHGSNLLAAVDGET